jgi:hypothetical protein
MRLLVSVASAADASAALAGGADVIDAKNPDAGALGAVAPAVLREISERVGTARLVTAALGDARDEETTERAARTFIEAGAAHVKIGFAGSAGNARVRALMAAAVRGARPGGVIAVAYADAIDAAARDRDSLIDIAAQAGATGILLDTFNKGGAGLRGLVSAPALSAWVAAAHDRGLLAAVAGKLMLEDLPFARDSGADVAGVRGAACVGGRTGLISAERVRLLRAQIDSPSRSAELSASLSSALTTNMAT